MEVPVGFRRQSARPTMVDRRKVVGACPPPSGPTTQKRSPHHIPKAPSDPATASVSCGNLFAMSTAAKAAAAGGGSDDDDTDTDSQSSTTDQDDQRVAAADGNDDDQETASEAEDKREVKASASTVPRAPSSLVKRPPKMRLKLSMRKLPTLANRKPLGAATDAAPDNDSDDDEVRAMVVDSDEGGDEQAVAATVLGEEPSAAAGTGSASVGAAKPKRRSLQGAATRQMRLPPIGSPGLYMAPPSVAPKERVTKAGLIAPSDVFDHHMALAGYTVENRTRRPHRGSSVTRRIGDMFDTDVALSLRFPDLIPPALGPRERKQDDDAMEVDREEPEPKDRWQHLADCLKGRTDRQILDGTEGSRPSCKRKKSMRMKDMVPVSLAITFPEDYVQRQIKYVQDVDAREQAIIEYQDAVFASQFSHTEEGSEDNTNALTSDATLPKVPPIPEPPAPPQLKELTGLAVDAYEDDGKGQIYLPKGKEHFVAHLDPNCFHVTNGRYFGLLSNFIADPNFVGPNAPGITGMSASGVSGLATSSSGGGISGAMALTLSTTYNGLTAGSAAAFRSAMENAAHDRSNTRSPVR